jgi:hypothetical protein
MGNQNPKARWDITVETGKAKLCNNNCRNCPNKQSLKTVTKISQVEK